jgi:hypothetical protein
LQLNSGFEKIVSIPVIYPMFEQSMGFYLTNFTNYIGPFASFYMLMQTAAAII